MQIDCDQFKSQEWLCDYTEYRHHRICSSKFENFTDMLLKKAVCFTDTKEESRLKWTQHVSDSAFLRNRHPLFRYIFMMEKSCPLCEEWLERWQTQKCLLIVSMPTVIFEEPATRVKCNIENMWFYHFHVYTCMSCMYVELRFMHAWEGNGVCVLVCVLKVYIGKLKVV